MRGLVPSLLLALLGLSACGSPVRGRSPTALLQAASSCNLGSTILLNGAGSSDPDGDIVLYRFVIADGTPEREETQPTISHVCRLAGLIEVGLQVEDAEGNSGWDTAVISVRRP